VYTSIAGKYLYRLSTLCLHVSGLSSRKRDGLFSRYPMSKQKHERSVISLSDIRLLSSMVRYNHRATRRQVKHVVMEVGITKQKEKATRAPIAVGSHIYNTSPRKDTSSFGVRIAAVLRGLVWLSACVITCGVTLVRNRPFALLVLAIAGEAVMYSNPVPV